MFTFVQTETQAAKYSENTNHYGSALCRLCGEPLNFERAKFVSQVFTGQPTDAHAIQLGFLTEFNPDAVFPVGPACARKLPSEVVFSHFPEGY